MSRDVIALLAESPSRRSLLEALAAADPDLRVRLVAEGTVVQLRDGSGRLVLAVQSAQRLAVSAEADRLLAEGIGDDLPAQPLWVEARGAALADTDTAGTARRFAHHLAGRHGGKVWEPRARLFREDHLLGGTDHPAVSAVTERNAVLVQDRPVVSLSSWTVDALARYGRAGLGLQLLTPATSVLTHAMRSLLGNPNAVWVVRTADGHHYDGFNGLPMTWQDGVGYVPDPRARTEDGPHRDFRAEEEHVSGTQLHVSLQVDHPASDDLELGGAVELLAERLGGAPPSVWGVSEPLTREWDTAGVTALARNRAPGETTLVFGGRPEGSAEEGTRPFAGRLRVSRTETGIREHVQFTVGHRADEDPDLDALRPLVRELSDRDGLRSMTVRRAFGRADLLHPPRWAGVPVPVGLAVGAEGVTSVGRESALAAPVRGVPFGPPMTPVVWYRIGDGVEPDGWERFQALMRHLRPARRPLRR
ncbi:hypothetical protein GCM10007079_14560 [Nocardiopsis terrae]|uniref:Uncharacterized protein n=1 Tax=Nocardiopsis terrae TaxID=372655 RepID=A0ABR9HBS3_9ACTN|nr:DUF6177 family protein [Nocardiopsis terrae]MBE1456341.1 hypothetical protein [Nocardiopsis terrae]GHC77400.1 hypothetical protein GCM10007079_14560 [Nocardiopsis terrae]